MNQTDKYRIYSITEAAREMHVGKDTLYRLISDGKIGTIQIGRREKIPASEIERFQMENVIIREKVEKHTEILIPISSKSKSKSLFRQLKEEMLNGKCL